MPKIPNGHGYTTNLHKRHHTHLLELRRVVRRTLEAQHGKCLDNDTEREQVADRIVWALEGTEELPPIAAIMAELETLLERDDGREIIADAVRSLRGDVDRLQEERAQLAEELEQSRLELIAAQELLDERAADALTRCICGNPLPHRGNPCAPDDEQNGGADQ